MILFHFGKRLLESKYVHIFSNATVPVVGILKNIIGYWVIFGLMIPIELLIITHKSLGPCWFPCRTFEMLCFVGFMVCEVLNGWCHWKLRMLRVKVVNGREVITKERVIPRGMFFDSIISPNYTFEICAWLFFIGFSRSYVCFLFICLGGYIMMVWAKGKKKKLLKVCKNDEEIRMVKRRDLIFPGLL